MTPTETTVHVTLNNASALVKRQDERVEALSALLAKRDEEIVSLTAKLINVSHARDEERDRSTSLRDALRRQEEVAKDLGKQAEAAEDELHRVLAYGPTGKPGLGHEQLKADVDAFNERFDNAVVEDLQRFVAIGGVKLGGWGRLLLELSSTTDRLREAEQFGQVLEGQVSALEAENARLREKHERATRHIRQYAGALCAAQAERDQARRELHDERHTYPLMMLPSRLLPPPPGYLDGSFASPILSTPPSPSTHVYTVGASIDALRLADHAARWSELVKQGPFRKFEDESWCRRHDRSLLDRLLFWR